MMERKAQSVPDFRGLEHFAKSTDPRAALFFVGWRSEIDDVETALSQAFTSGVTDSTAGGTRLIQRAPGAGETVLLARLRTG